MRLPPKSWKNHLKKLLTLAEIPSFQKFFITAQTAKMADFMFQNMAYRATVYRTGVSGCDVFEKSETTIWVLIFAIDICQSITLSSKSSFT